MQEVRLALIGFGNVARGLVQILAEHGENYTRNPGLHILITAITDTSQGTAFHPDGIDPHALLDIAASGGRLDALNAPGVKHPGWDALEMIAHAPADIVVEMSYTDLNSGEPASAYIAEALRRKKHVVTTNKGPIALRYGSLAELARLNDVQLAVEGTVMSGTPVLRVGQELIAPAGLRRIQGILNGTSNYILTQMESGLSYEDALAEAQRLGYAEADPTNDVEGCDAAAKVAILAHLVLGQAIPFGDVERQGITHLSPEEITAARAAGERWKLVGSLEKTSSGWQASVCPRRLPQDHPLARISGNGNAIIFSTEMLGDVLIQGPGAGRVETGYAVIQDIFNIYRSANL